MDSQKKGGRILVYALSSN